MTLFSSIVIVYNPNSTGPSKKNAQTFANKLTPALAPSTTLTTIATTHAGHAEELTHEYAKKSGRTLIISSSGDGGYHEVINGALASGSRVTTGLLPSGNANDHYHALHQPGTVERIRKASARKIDVLQVTVSGSAPWKRYAHSYVGLGLTPYIGEKLTKADLNKGKEIWLVIKHLFMFSPVSIKVDGHKQRYDSVIASTIPKMSKMMHLSNDASVSDGLFELSTKKSTSLFALVVFLLRSVVPIGQTPLQYTSYSFRTRRALKLQLDGEVYDCAAGSHVTITCEKQKLTCII